MKPSEIFRTVLLGKNGKTQLTKIAFCTSLNATSLPFIIAS